MGTMTGMERSSWRDGGQNRHILEVLLLLRAVGNVVRLHRDSLQTCQHYSKPVQEHKDYSGTMAMEASADQHSNLHSKPVLQIITCHSCRSWKWTSLGQKDLKALQKEPVRASQVPRNWCCKVLIGQAQIADATGFPVVEFLHRQGDCQRLPVPASGL
ncbi:hypothetical protein llap_10574 [Limosa lapponica baueri]|uniref:Uncharacterized protein n=1 Tax=Limosa lapponica baueri TaxID=1758121 RepID=A0A2I0TZB2_LIMLA|nr:hypothetical protein llap_10574 [Limosa lapponica baueri]